VGVQSVQDPNFDRVTPGNPDDSYLIMKLEGDPRITLDQMPKNGPPLSQAEIDVIREWIQRGAFDD